MSGRERTIILQPAIGRGFTHKNPAKVRTRGPGNLDARIGRNNAVTSLLSETHIAVLKANRIVASMEDAWSLLQTESGALSRAVNFVSGPSRTADIEQTITLGAHGPYRVHIVLVKD